MASGLTTYSATSAITKTLDHLFGNAAYTQPTGHKLRLYKGEPDVVTPPIVDVVNDDINYLEQTITFEAADLTVDGRVYNDNLITFAGSSGVTDPYEVTHWAVVDGVGAMLATGQFPAAISRVLGEPLTLNIGALYVELTRTV